MHIVIIVKKKTGYLYGFRHGECHDQKLQINVLFYNGAKFDFRLLISHLAEKCTHSNISCLAHSMETFLTFSITNFNNTGINLRFIDSYKHLTSSLGGLVNSFGLDPFYCVSAPDFSNKTMLNMTNAYLTFASFL